MNRLPLAFGLILSFSSVGAYAQSPAPGFPTYGSFDGDGLARINLQNLNVNLVFPIMSGPGRSLNTYARVSYNSSVWNPSAGFWYPVVDQSGASSWGWNEFNFVGVLNYTSAKIQCGTHLYDFYMRYSHFVYVDTVGTNHSFNVTFTVAGTCGTTSGSRTGYATNGSGYYLNASGGT